MAKKQNPKQREIVARVMREFKHSDLASSSGQNVENPRKAIAVALHEAGASREETPAGNRRNLARTVAKERRAEAGRTRGSGQAAPAARMRRGGDRSRAALYEEAARRGISGRSRMTKAQLARALGR